MRRRKKKERAKIFTTHPTSIQKREEGTDQRWDETLFYLGLLCHLSLAFEKRVKSRLGTDSMKISGRMFSLTGKMPVLRLSYLDRQDACPPSLVP
jgi:hypothetical protein